MPYRRTDWGKMQTLKHMTKGKQVGLEQNVRLRETGGVGGMEEPMRSMHLSFQMDSIFKGHIKDILKLGTEQDI